MQAGFEDLLELDLESKGQGSNYYLLNISKILEQSALIELGNNDQSDYLINHSLISRRILI